MRANAALDPLHHPTDWARLASCLRIGTTDGHGHRFGLTPASVAPWSTIAIPVCVARVGLPPGPAWHKNGEQGGLFHVSFDTPHLYRAVHTLHHCTMMPRLLQRLCQDLERPSSKLAMGMATQRDRRLSNQLSKLRTDRMLRTVASRITLTSAARWGSCATSSSSNSGASRQNSQLVVDLVAQTSQRLHGLRGWIDRDRLCHVKFPV
ncbi:MAG: hypothetical protein IPG23_25370 [Burkholderiales bacterium]|nr:hypothetical protein [Burkholderiales bacterium]